MFPPKPHAEEGQSCFPLSYGRGDSRVNVLALFLIQSSLVQHLIPPTLSRLREGGSEPMQYPTIVEIPGLLMKRGRGWNPPYSFIWGGNGMV